MLLRRIDQHIRDQNWFAVFIDFCIVVIGVFIGIQVANWNETRADRELAEIYIDRIQDDLRANQSDMAMRIQYFSDIRDHAMAALEAYDKDVEDLDEQFLIDSFVASFSLRRSFQRNTYDELLSAGAMRTIPDLGVRNRIAEYYRVVDGSELYLNSIPAYVNAVRQTMPYEVQNALRQNGCNATFSMNDDGAIPAMIPQECPLEISQDDLSRAIKRLHDAGLDTDLTGALANVDVKLTLMNAWIDRAQNLYDYLEEAKS